MGQGQVNHTRTAGKDQLTEIENLLDKKFRGRQLVSLSTSISGQVLGYLGATKRHLRGKEKYLILFSPFSLNFSTLCFGFVTVSWPNVNLGNNHPIVQ